MGERDVVVTGIGLMTPLGESIDTFWESISKGQSHSFRVNRGYSGYTRFIHLALDAAEDAIADARLPREVLREAGVTISSSKGGILHMQGPALQMDCLPDTAAMRCAERFGCRGPCVNVISACATGLDSIIIGASFIKTGRVDIVLAGGTDACLVEFVISAYSRLGVLAKDLCRPYDRRRTGFQLSEGAAVVVLEDGVRAQQRRVKGYGRITGWASLGEGYHVTSLEPTGEAIAEAIRLTCKSVDDVDYVNTHGTGTIENDTIETLALKKALGRRVYEIPMSSTKAVTGHMLGASGVVEFIIGLLAMEKGFVPPTMNLEEPDPRCDLDFTPLIGRCHKIGCFLTLSYGFGGHVCAMEVKRL